MYRTTAPLALLLILAVSLIGCAPDGDVASADVAFRTPTPRPTATPTPTRTPTPTPSPTPTPVPEVQAVALSNVTQLRIPRFGVSSAVEEIGILPSNQLDTPRNPHNTGWYNVFDAPGLPGNAVFSAHVDYYPNIKGPFNRLASLAAGDHVVVVADGKQLVYEVVSNRRYTIYDIPMSEVIWPTNRPTDEEWVTLITCGGRFVSSRPGGPGEYLDRDVVVARRIE